MKLSALFLSFFVLFPVSLFAAPNPPGCAVVGIPASGEFYKSSKRKCFANVKKATSKGYVDSASGSVVRGFSFSLLGSEEVPPVTSSGSGSCLVALLADQTTVRVICTHTLTDASAAHIHEGAIGLEGSVICDLGNGASPISASCTLTSAQVQELLNGTLYVNVHTATNSGGEIRGQVD